MTSRRPPEDLRARRVRSVWIGILVVLLLYAAWIAVTGPNAVKVFKFDYSQGTSTDPLARLLIMMGHSAAWAALIALISVRVLLSRDREKPNLAEMQSNVSYVTFKDVTIVGNEFLSYTEVAREVNESISEDSSEKRASGARAVISTAKELAASGDVRKANFMLDELYSRIKNSPDKRLLEVASEVSELLSARASNS